MKCAWVENMMSIETDGWSRPCCLETSEDARISPIQDGILNAFNHQRLLDLRDNLKNGYSEKTRHACHRCEQLESQGHASMRTETKFESPVRELKVLQFKMSNKCQLTCAHCGPDRSSGWAKLLNISPHVINAFEVTDKFLDELVEILPNLEVLKFSGGEPFLDPNHWKILEHLQSYDTSHCELQYITNGISPFKSELWKKWKRVNCSVSVDGYKDSYEWFRRGSSWDRVVQGVYDLKKVSDVHINYAITPYTFHDYNNAKEFWKEPIHGFPVVYPSYMSMLGFPSRIVSLIDNWTDIPYADSAKGSSALTYKMWAKSWDKQWNTPGWAEKLFHWVN